MRKRQNTIAFTFLFIVSLLLCSVKSATALTIFYSGEEQGKFGLHGCGSKQVGRLAHRYNLIENLYIRHPGAVLNLHTGNLIDATDKNVEQAYQTGLSALEAIKVDVLCLGPNELSLPSETLAALQANHPEIKVTCANVKRRIEKPYLIQVFASYKVAVVGLIAETYSQALPDVSMEPPQNALSELKSELVDKSDIIVIVFHGTQEEAHTLAKTIPWIDVLIVASNQKRDTYGVHSPSIFTGEKAIVTNVSQGNAIGVLEVERDSVLRRHIFTNAYHGYFGID